MRRDRNTFGNVDWIMLSIYLALVLIGWLSIYAAVYAPHSSIFDISNRGGKQLIWIGTSLVLAFIILIIDENFFPGFAYPIYGVIILILLAVLVFGTEIKGAKSWFTIGSFAIQPSEFAKFCTGLALAKYLSALNISLKNLKTKLIAAGIIVLPALLILLQNDTGSTLVYAAFILVLYREGLSGNYILCGIYAAGLFIVSLLLRNKIYHFPFHLIANGNYLIIIVLLFILLAGMWLTRKKKKIWLLLIAGWILSSCFIFSVNYIFNKVLEPHQAKRIDVVLGIEKDPKGVGYNVNQSLIAIGSGGFSGKGYLKGTQTKYNFIPEQSTDFIFCTIGEEWGFLGTFLVVILYLALFVRIIFVAERQNSSFSRIYGYCVASILFIHFLINIGMVIGIAPVIGIPLPFISYGGSSLWAFTILLFIFIKLDRDRLLNF